MRDLEEVAGRKHNGGPDLSQRQKRLKVGNATLYILHDLDNNLACKVCIYVEDRHMFLAAVLFLLVQVRVELINIFFQPRDPNQLSLCNATIQSMYMKNRHHKRSVAPKYD